jgi:hypothetical protein
MRQAYDQALQGWSEAMEKMVASEGFASASGQVLARYVEMQEAMRTAARAGAESLHLPTLDDLARVARLVVNVERKLDDLAEEARAVTARLTALEAAIEELARRTPPKTAPRSRASKAGTTSAAKRRGTGGDSG